MPNQKRWSKLISINQLQVGQRFYSARRVPNGWQTALYVCQPDKSWDFIKLAPDRTQHAKLRVCEERGLTHAKGSTLCYVPYQKGPLWKQEQQDRQMAIWTKQLEESHRQESLWQAFKQAHDLDGPQEVVIRQVLGTVRAWAKQRHPQQGPRSRKAEKLSELWKKETQQDAAPPAIASIDLEAIELDFFELCEILTNQIKGLRMKQEIDEVADALYDEYAHYFREMEAEDYL